jgi:hypothetical protein
MEKRVVQESRKNELGAFRKLTPKIDESPDKICKALMDGTESNLQPELVLRLQRKLDARKTAASLIIYALYSPIAVIGVLENADGVVTAGAVCAYLGLSALTVRLLRACMGQERGARKLLESGKITRPTAQAELAWIVIRRGSTSQAEEFLESGIITSSEALSYLEMRICKEWGRY